MTLSLSSGGVSQPVGCMKGSMEQYLVTAVRKVQLGGDAMDGEWVCPTHDYHQLTI